MYEIRRSVEPARFPYTDGLNGPPLLNNHMIEKLLKLKVYCPTKSGAVWNNTNGIVIFDNFLKLVAPSISAAS